MKRTISLALFGLLLTAGTIFSADASPFNIAVVSGNSANSVYKVTEDRAVLGSKFKGDKNLLFLRTVDGKIQEVGEINKRGVSPDINSNHQIVFEHDNSQNGEVVSQTIYRVGKNRVSETIATLPITSDSVITYTAIGESGRIAITRSDRTITLFDGPLQIGNYTFPENAIYDPRAWVLPNGKVIIKGLTSSDIDAKSVLYLYQVGSAPSAIESDKIPNSLRDIIRIFPDGRVLYSDNNGLYYTADLSNPPKLFTITAPGSTQKITYTNSGLTFKRAEVGSSHLVPVGKEMRTECLFLDSEINLRNYFPVDFNSKGDLLSEGNPSLLLILKSNPLSAPNRCSSLHLTFVGDCKHAFIERSSFIEQAPTSEYFSQLVSLPGISKCTARITANDSSGRKIPQFKVAFFKRHFFNSAPLNLTAQYQISATEKAITYPFDPKDVDVLLAPFHSKNFRSSLVTLNNIEFLGGDPG